MTIHAVDPTTSYVLNAAYDAEKELWAINWEAEADEILAYMEDLEQALGPYYPTRGKTLVDLNVIDNIPY